MDCGVSLQFSVPIQSQFRGSVIKQQLIEIVYLVYSVEAQLHRIILWHTALRVDDCD